MAETQLQILGDIKKILADILTELRGQGLIMKDMEIELSSQGVEMAEQGQTLDQILFYLRGPQAVSATLNLIPGTKGEKKDALNRTRQ